MSFSIQHFVIGCKKEKLFWQQPEKGADDGKRENSKNVDCGQWGWNLQQSHIVHGLFRSGCYPGGGGLLYGSFQFLQYTCGAAVALQGFGKLEGYQLLYGKAAL